MISMIKKIINFFSVLNRHKQDINEIKILIANCLIKQNLSINKLSEAEFKVFSQWGDDGIIQYLINNIEINNKIFIEFGVENYTEANTRFLLMNNNWKGLVMDGSVKNINYIKNDSIYWKYELTAKSCFVTAENINQQIAGEGIEGKIGILHIDIDGNDYWIWKNISVVDAEIVIIEYNSIFGYDRPITIPYNSAFIRANYHYSNLYYGTSLLSLCDLAEDKGYFFVGCNSAGNNAYFVKKEKIGNIIKPLKPNEGFIASKFRESRDTEGQLTFLSGDTKYETIKGLKVYNTRLNQLEDL